MAKKKPSSLQEILRVRQQEEFVGREEQLAFFQANLGYDIEDPRRRFIISISGQGGVGKTWLLRRFQKMAKEAGAITGFTDEADENVPDVMGRIAVQLETEDHALETFAERYKVYRQKLQQIEADPNLPGGLPTLLGRTLAKGGLHLARTAPGVSVAAEFVDEEAFASLVGEFTSFVAQKIRNKDEVRLVLEPIDTLTPLFLADLRKVAKKGALALFFDTYERTGNYLDDWLRELLEGRHGEVSAGIALVIAGRNELDHNHWAPYEGLLARIPLEPFTEGDAQEYLARKGITDARVVKVILELSGRMPLLVATLAAESPDDPERVGDPSGEAVERFLWWVEDRRQRQLALDAALPRSLNRDVIAVMTEEDEADALFEWLRQMPFIKKRNEGWAYHDVVRSQMLRRKRHESPRGWADLHRRLAEYFEDLRDDLGIQPDMQECKNETWQKYALAARYHRLCQAPEAQLPTALSDFLMALKSRLAYALRFARVLAYAGEDSETSSLLQWSRRLTDGLHAYEEERHREAAEMFTLLLEQPGLTDKRRGIALVHRGITYVRSRCLEDALVDLSEGWQLEPELPKAVVYRGIANRDTGHFDEALADFGTALELGLDQGWVLANRGVAYLRMRRNEEALRDFDQAIELRPDMVWPVLYRGITYRDIPCFEEALQDFKHALELGLDEGWVLANRGIAYRLMSRYDEALADLTRATKLRPDIVWARANRGTTYRLMGRFKEALADLNLAVESDPSFGWAFGGRGVTYRQLRRYEDALNDFNRAIELSPGHDWWYHERGLTYQVLDRPEQALADFSQAIKLARKTSDTRRRDWNNVLNLALHHEAAGDTEDSRRLFTEASRSDVSPYRLRLAVLDLDGLEPIRKLVN